MIQQEALRCKDITQKLLDFSRTGERKREPTDLAGLVRGVLEVARHLPNCRGKDDHLRADRLHRRPGQRPGPEERDPEPGGERPGQHGRRRAGWRSRSATAGGYAEMVFADTGCGMTAGRAAEHLRAVLHQEPHRQGDGAGAVHQPPDHRPARRHDRGAPAPARATGARSPSACRCARRRAGSGEPERPEPAVLPFPGAREAA